MKKNTSLIILTEKDLQEHLEDRLMFGLRLILEEIKEDPLLNLEQSIFFQAGSIVRSMAQQYANRQDECNFVIIEKPKENIYTPLSYEGFIRLNNQIKDGTYLKEMQFYKRDMPLSEYVTRIEIPIVQNKIKEATEKNDGYLLMFRTNQLYYLESFGLDKNNTCAVLCEY